MPTLLSMRFFTFFIALSQLARLSSAAAIDEPDWENNTGPLGGTLITDPDRLAELNAIHDTVLESLNSNTAIPVERHANLTESNQHDARAFHVFGLLGVYLTSQLGLKALEKVLDALLDLFTADDDVIWESRDNCRAYFSTQGGGNEEFRTYARDHGQATAVDKKNVGWNNPANTAPPIHFFEGDPAIGLYSVQYTATDTVAWSGIPGTQKCKIQGLCNPHYIFYHKGYQVVLSTWESQGERAKCQYSHGQDCRGLCSSGVKSQFPSGGVRWGGDCAIPCIDDVPDDFITVPNEEASFMVVGDSISHGMQDDWTWRYRLSQWLDSNGYIHHFVGPWKGTHANKQVRISQPNGPLFPGEEPLSYTDTPGPYAGGVPDSFRNTGHASMWGRQAAQSRHTIKGWVSEYKPDYLLILLGFNDLGWWVSGPEGLVGDMGNLVQAAREAKPDIKLLVGNVVHRTFIKGRQDLVDNTNRYNILLRDTLPNWFRWESPIAYVDVNTDYDCRPHGCPDAYDGLHPNARGEYHIAQAFARTLQKHFGYNGKEFQVPGEVDPRPVSTPVNVRTGSHPEGMFTTWDPVANNRGYEIRSRIQGATGWWSEGGVYPNTHGSWATWVANGQTWEYQVRTKGDNDVRSDWSALSSATVNVKTAPGPSNIIVEPQGNDVLVRWDPVPGFYVDRYGVYVLDKTTPDSWLNIHPTKETSIVLKDLKPGLRYGIWVSTYVGMIGYLTKTSITAGGIPAAARDIIVGAGAPAVPVGLSVYAIDATTVRLNWHVAMGVTGYNVYVRSVKDNTALRLDGTTTQTSHEVYMLFPGIWNFEFCVSAFNGNAETAPVACIIPPVCCGFEKRDSVPGNYTIVENTSTVYNSTGLVEDEGIRDLFAAYRQAAEFASVIDLPPL